MNSVLENSYAWTSNFVEAISSLTCDVASLILSSLSLTSNTSDSDSSSSPATTSTSSSQVVSGSAEKTVFQEAASWFACDDFQFLLFKIFLAIFVSNLCLIYIIWNIYGERIGDRFMTDESSSAELKRSASQLKLPKEHTERYL